MKEFVLTPIELFDSKIGFAGITIYSYLYYLCSRNLHKTTTTTNKILAEKFNVDIKTVKASIALLKEQKYIEIFGKTKNRRIKCLDPYQIQLNKKVDEAKLYDEKIKQLRVEKWYIEYLQETNKEQLVSDIQSFIDGNAFEITLAERTNAIEALDPMLIPEATKKQYKEHIKLDRRMGKESADLKKRAGAYEKQHKGKGNHELKQFLIDNFEMIPEKYSTLQPSTLSECPLGLQKIFLDWIEPELF